MTIFKILTDLNNELSNIYSNSELHLELKSKRTIGKVLTRLQAFCDVTEEETIKEQLIWAFNELGTILESLETFSKLRQQFYSLSELTKSDSLQEGREESFHVPPENDYSITKQYYLSPKVVKISISESVGSSLSTSCNIVEQDNAETFFKDIKSSNQAPMFFGTSYGQRLHRVAFHALGKRSGELQKAISEKHAEKSEWDDVVNYWLKSELASFRKIKQKKNSGISKEFRDWCVISKDTPKSMLWSNFSVAQRNLVKDYSLDIKRPAYKHKPISDFWDMDSDKPRRLAYIEQDLINRRVCKFILFLCAYHRRPIVYALDKMDLTAVATGAVLEISMPAEDRIKMKVPVCTSELREIFRNYDYYQHAVHFTSGLKKVSPPWLHDSCANSWAEYALHLIRKLLILHNTLDTSDIGKVKFAIEAYSNGDYASTIKLYHELNPSKYLGIQKLLFKKEKAKTISNSHELCAAYIQKIESLLIPRVSEVSNRCVATQGF